MATDTITRRTLNRTLLARQLLLDRADMGVPETVAHVMGMQSQAPTSPYPGLWTRLASFDFAELGRQLTERSVVRLVLMRNTVHLVTAADALRLRPWLQQKFESQLRTSQWAAGIAGLDQSAVTRHGRALLAEGPMTPAQLRAALGERFPSGDPASLVQALRVWLPLVQVPPRGIWGAGGQTCYATAEDWLGRPLADPDPADLVRRYLAAYGPASPADMQKWCGLTGLRKVFGELDLLTYAAEDGRVLYDLPGAALTDPSVEVSARFVADFDNLVLSHAERSRILPDGYRGRVMTVNGIVRGTVLIDGFIGGTWRFERAKGSAAVLVTPFAALRPADRDALAAEGVRLLAASDPDTASPEVRFEAP